MKILNNFMINQFKKTSQAGFSPILVVVLLTAGVLAGSFLVQNGVSFLPRAAEQEGLNPSAGKTEDCSALPDTQLEACKQRNNATCAADAVTYCDNRSGNKAVRKSGGYWDPANQFQVPKSGCVFDYREVPGKKAECSKPESESGDVVYTTREEAQMLDSERKPSQGQSGQPGLVANTACTDLEGPALKSYYDAKIANNLIRFYAILEGVDGMCIPSDLGVEPREDATGVSPDGKTTIKDRLFLCSGEAKSGGDLPDLLWRVPDVKNRTLLPVPGKNTPERNATVESEFKNLLKARCVAGLEPKDKCKEV